MRRAIREGQLRASLVGGRWIVKDTAVEEWIDGCANGYRPAATPSPPRLPPNRAQSGSASRPGSVADLEAIRERMLSQ